MNRSVLAASVAQASHHWRNVPAELVLKLLAVTGPITGVLRGLLAVLSSASAGDDSGVVDDLGSGIINTVVTTAGTVPDACIAAPAGLVGRWPAEGDAQDFASTNHGVLQGGAKASALGWVGQAFSLDGTNEYVQIADSPALRPANLTIEAWVFGD